MKLFDIETNGLLDTVTKVHCLVIKDRTTGRKFRCIPAGFPMQADMTIEQGLELLKSGPIGGHGILRYDIPVLEKLYPDFTYDKDQVFDTLVAARLIWTHIKDIDNGLLKKKQIPGSLYGSHSLEAWGYRLKLQKGEYAAEFKARVGDAYEGGMEWRELSPEMLDYCDLDVDVTDALFDRIEGKNYSAEALELEHRIAWLMAQQERNGFPFDVTKASALYAKLAQRRGELERELKEFFRFWFAPAGTVTPKVGNKARGTVAGVPYTKVKIVEFNPGSRDHIANRLVTLYGWKPEVFTDGGKPRVDEDVMARLDYPPTKLLTEYLLVSKRISQLAEGDQAWLKVVRDGKIHGSVNPNGAVTGRCTHAFPNVAQVPAVGSPYGEECRGLFGAPKGWLLVGSDASGLELRCLAHFMARHDGGKYGKVILEGDIHTENQKAAGLPTRNNAKTFIYAFLYGAGDAKIGKIVGKDAAEGKKLKAAFLKKTPALKKLLEAVRESAKRGYLVGLDKRQLHVRSQHAALNTLLQSAGALICKYWVVRTAERMEALGYKHGWDGDFAFVAYIHDEQQVAVRNEEVAKVLVEQVALAMKDAEAWAGFRCPLACESKVGTDWASTH
ncbi:DNA-directed DNA polymerase [Ralstonia phage vRsoP-WM2]|nr:DNA-directed DNA polymerase [Ralstonia phage vRsoP-WM2]